MVPVWHFVSDHCVVCAIRLSNHSISRQHVCLEVDNHYDVSDPSSIMKLTIQDLNGKHKSTWNEDGFVISLHSL